jgi:hypothetical protein
MLCANGRQLFFVALGVLPIIDFSFVLEFAIVLKTQCCVLSRKVLRQGLTGL